MSSHSSSQPPKKPGRGEVWYCNFSPVIGNEQAGRRPCLIVSNDRMNQSAGGLVIVCPITTTPPRIPSHLPIPALNTGLDHDSTVRCEKLRAVSIDRLDAAPIGKADAATMAKVSLVLKRLLDL